MDAPTLEYYKEKCQMIITELTRYISHMTWVCLLYKMILGHNGIYVDVGQLLSTKSF